VNLIVYLLCVPLVRPTPDYRLPRPTSGIADLLLLCFSSSILDDTIHDKPVFSQRLLPKKIHLESRVHLAKQDYHIGLYQGKDGRRHTGFDVVERQGSAGPSILVDNIDHRERVIFLFPHKHLVSQASNATTAG